jgi:geranylgeranyl diphosphate synthase type II
MRLVASPNDAAPDRWADDVEAALQSVISQGAASSQALGAGYERLWHTLTDAARGGKRFRPALFAAGYRAWGGTDRLAAAAVGASIELLHTAFVVHDDVIDGDDLRRGRPNVSGSHAGHAGSTGAAPDRAREFGVAAGILAGDLALAAAIRTLATCPVDPATLRALLDLFDRVLHVSAAGELADVWVGVSTEEPTVQEALLLAERKTGEYSFALPLEAAALLAGAPSASVTASRAVGRALGVAYQLADDLQGVFGDPEVTGKSALSDLRSGKQTPLVAHARTTQTWPAIAPYVGLASLTETEAGVVRGLLEESGSRRFVEELAATHLDTALVLARRADLPVSLVTWVGAVGTDLLERAA